MLIFQNQKKTSRYILSFLKYSHEAKKMRSKKNKNEKLLEQCRKEFVGSQLNSLFRLISTFDFFSQDAFALMVKAKLCAHQYKAKHVNSKMLMLAVTRSRLRMMQFYHVKIQHQLEDLVGAELKFDCLKLAAKRLLARAFLHTVKEQEVLLPLSNTCLFLLEKSSKNARNRFYTPLISLNILILTMMEENQLNTGKLFKSALGSQLKWLVFHYKLIRLVYEQEATIRKELKPKHFHYFYLLISLIPESKYNFELKKKRLQKKTLRLRLFIIKQALRVNKLKFINNLFSQCFKKRHFSLKF